MIADGGSAPSTRVENWESPCPYCGCLMKEEVCPECGRICPRCGTPSKEPACPQCGHGSPTDGYGPTGSPGPAQSPELSDVQRILGRTPSMREFNMVRGIIDKDRERVHRLTELLCERFPAPLSRELIEMRAIQVRNKARKSGTEVTHAESVIFSFLEAARYSGMLESATRALAESQLLDANLRLGLSVAKLPPLKFVVEVSRGFEAQPVLLVNGAPRNCKVVLMGSRPHGKTYQLVWRPFLADCLEDNSGIPGRRVSASIESKTGSVPLLIAWESKPGAKSWHIDIDLD